MEIKTYLNTTKEEVKSKKFNIWFGISIGNRYFTKNNIKQYISFGIDNTNDKLLILIPDELNIINYEVKYKYSKEKAKELALKQGEEYKRSILKILNTFPKEKQCKVIIVKWKDITFNNIEYQNMKNLLLKEFDNNQEFHRVIINIVKENVKNNEFSDKEFSQLASYILDELPLFISSLKYEGNIFGLLIYPGIGIDYLTIDLQIGKQFPELTKKLNIKTKAAFLEIYPE